MIYRIVRVVVLSIFKVLFRVRVTGREHVPRDGVYIVAPSHRSILDTPFTAYVTRRRIRFMAKRELFSTRVGRVVFNAMGAISVDRGATDRAALRACQETLEAGEPVCLFPEGTRNSGPTLGTLHDGVAYLALKLGVPIVPVGIGGSEEILATGKVIPRIHKIVVVIGPPIEPSPRDGTRRRSEITKLTEEVRVRLQRSFDDALDAAGARRRVTSDQ